MLKIKFTRQYNIGGWLGGLKDIFTRTLFYITAINFVLLAATAYHTTLGLPLRGLFPWFTFSIFMGIMVVLVLILMVVEYKIVLPSTISYLNAQGYKHQNPIREQLDRIEKTLKSMKENTQ